MNKSNIIDIIRIDIPVEEIAMKNICNIASIAKNLDSQSASIVAIAII